MSSIHRYPTFEVDEARRELRAGARVIALQPRVFDLLVFLVRNHDRVVPKDELLEAVWPDVIVTDASLQRAVSIARAALAEAGAENAIRTFARQGDRFCLESATCAAQAEAVGAAKTPAGALQGARAAYEAGEWEVAIDAFRQVDDVEGLTGADLQRWAHAAQCAGRPSEAVPALERAVAAFTARGDRKHAAWAAILIAQLRVEWRELVLAKGWCHRAARLLENVQASREHGYLDLLGARMALMQNELETSLELAEKAWQAGERFNDPDLESLGLVHVGESKLYLGRIREGLAALDEAGVSVVASGLSPWAGGLVYCGVIFTCMTRADWQRAGQWTDQFTRWCEGKGTAGYPGLCRMHRAEVLTVRGDLSEAEKETRATIEMLARQAPWAEGDAWRVLGDVLLARGELAEARSAYSRAHELGWEAQFGLAMVRFAEGDPQAAASLLARAIAENAWSARTHRGQALAYYVIFAVAADSLDEARRALAELEQEPELVSTPALQALVARARGEVAAAEGRTGEAIGHMRAALRTWQSIEAPLVGAQTRCRLADLLDAEGDSESAALELRAAVTVFQQAGATGLIENCERMRQALRGAERATTKADGA